MSTVPPVPLGRQGDGGLGGDGADPIADAAAGIDLRLHVQYCLWVVNYPLPTDFTDADCHRIPLLYFALNTLDVMGCLAAVTPTRKAAIVDWVYRCASWRGVPRRCGVASHVSTGVLMGTADGGAGTAFVGFDGGTFAPPCTSCGGHVATTYAALAALIILGDDLSRLPVQDVLSTLATMIEPYVPPPGPSSIPTDAATVRATGSDAEADVRYLYAALAIAALLCRGDVSRLPSAFRPGHPACAFQAFRRYLAACQSWDGGYGLVPGGSESHGGSTYCVVACAVLMQWLEDGAGAAPTGTTGAGGGDRAGDGTAGPVFAPCAFRAGEGDAAALMRWLHHRQRWPDLRDMPDLAAYMAESGETMSRMKAMEGGTTDDAAADGGGSGDEDDDDDEEEEEPLTMHDHMVLAGPGGLTGRPGKPADTCYTFWIGASLAMVGLNPAAVFQPVPLVKFLAACQFRPLGGFSKDVEAYSDPMHTFYATAGLGLQQIESLGFDTVVPPLAMTQRAVAWWWGQPPPASSAAKASVTGDGLVGAL